MEHRDLHTNLRPPLEVEKIDESKLTQRELALIAAGSVLCARLNKFIYTNSHEAIDRAATAIVSGDVLATEKQTAEMLEHVRTLFSVCRRRTEVELRTEEWLAKGRPVNA